MGPYTKLNIKEANKYYTKDRVSVGARDREASEPLSCIKWI